MVGMLHYRFNYVGLTCMDDFVVVGLERVVYDQIFCGLVLLQRETVSLYQVLPIFFFNLFYVFVNFEV